MDALAMGSNPGLETRASLGVLRTRPRRWPWCGCTGALIIHMN